MGAGQKRENCDTNTRRHVEWHGLGDDGFGDVDAHTHDEEEQQPMSIVVDSDICFKSLST